MMAMFTLQGVMPNSYFLQNPIFLCRRLRCKNICSSFAALAGGRVEPWPKVFKQQ